MTKQNRELIPKRKGVVMMFLLQYIFPIIALVSAILLFRQEIFGFSFEQSLLIIVLGLTALFAGLYCYLQKATIYQYNYLVPFCNLAINLQQLPREKLLQLDVSFLFRSSSLIQRLLTPKQVITIDDLKDDETYIRGLVDLLDPIVQAMDEVRSVPWYRLFVCHDKLHNARMKTIMNISST